MKWIVLLELPTEIEAQILQGKLDTHGIQSRVTCDNLGGLHAGISPALASAKLHVMEDKKAEALEVLKTDD